MRHFKEIAKINNRLISLFLLGCFLSATLSTAWAGNPVAPESMVLINPGGFIRGMDKPESTTGSPSDSIQAFKDESPARQIYLGAYYIDIYEVSNAHYTEFIKATDYPAPAYWDHHKLNQPNLPVTGVNWYDANAYCHWANKRLPTEAEWEKAARGPGGYVYPWGNKLDSSKANFGKGNSGKKHVTSNVDSHPEGKSYYGLFNMAGNVFEWVQDWYDPNYYKTSKEVRNPKGPQLALPLKVSDNNFNHFSNGNKKVIRGGSWFAPAQSVTTTHRFWNDPMNNSYGVGLGFRCARDVNTNPEMEARAFYMDALIKLGAEKYKNALTAINKALLISPENNEYQSLKQMIEKRQGN